MSIDASPKDSIPDSPSSTRSHALGSSSLAIRRVPISSLAPDPSNPRLHGPRNLDAIIASLRRFGQAEPLVVQAGTGRVVAGHGRLLAMKQLGWAECDVVELPLDDLAATSLNVALNRSAELAEWDEPVLAKLLEQLRSEDQLEGVGFSNNEIDKLLAEMADATPAEVDDPGPQEPAERAVSKLGDVWILGDHKLLVGDSLNPSDVARVLGGEKSKILSTDSPYQIAYHGDDRPAKDGGKSGKNWEHVYVEGGPEDAEGFYDRFLSVCLPHVVGDAALYLWHAHVNYVTLVRVLERHGLFVHQLIVWVKPVATFGHSVFRWRHEPCAFGWRRGNKPPHSAANFETVWECDWDGRARVTGNFHPTEKPVRLFEIPMLVHTVPGDIVLEPFSGSGSQIIAAERLRRRCRAIDLQPVFVDGSILRFEKATGKKAILEESGRTFDQIRAERLGEGTP